jgi:hypothetical protein
MCLGQQVFDPGARGGGRRGGEAGGGGSYKLPGQYFRACTMKLFTAIMNAEL